MVSKFTKYLILGVAAVALIKQSFAEVTMNNLDQNADQSQGSYAPMNMDYAGFSSLGMTQAAWLDPLQNLGEGQSRPAYSKYYWSPDLVLPIRLREGMMTRVNFPDWELIEDMYIGDNATIDGQITGPNTILLYPRKGANVGVDTNVILFGRSGNRYVFYVKSEGVNTERLTNSIIDIEVLENGSEGGNHAYGNSRGAGNYSASGKSVTSKLTKRNQRNNWIEEIPVDPSKFRFDIEIYVPNPDDVVIAPERVWRDDIFTYIDLGAKALNMTTTEVYTLASIVDEETANNAEKPMIAGLYINRLKKGMLLQADPTVKFSMQDFGLKRILFKHLETDSPYNTYKYAGLPPGPIRIASTTGINSVLNYSRHNFLYMCAKEDFSGTHNFASSLAEHNINARKYQQALNKRNIK